MARIHPTALVDATAELAEDVDVGAYSIIGAHVAIGAGSRIGPHVVITGRTRFGARNRVFQFASIGDIPQDRKYGGEPTTTTIGNDNLFLAYTHVAHDCVVGNATIFSNNAQIAGHVKVDDWVVMGAYGGVHQFCRIGAHAMIGAGAKVHQDVPPFVTAAGDPARPHGTNAEGLRRRGFSAADILAIRRAYKTLYRQGHSLEDARAMIAEVAAESPALRPLVDFLGVPGRGIIR